MEINKKYLITLGISILTTIVLAIILLMLFLPKQAIIFKGNVGNYESIQKSEYTFEATKDISSEPLKTQYTITSNDMRSFGRTNEYVPGNTDPFVPITKQETYDKTKMNATRNQEKVQQYGTYITEAHNQSQQEAIKRTTNNNGGVENPSSTEK